MPSLHLIWRALFGLLSLATVGLFLSLDGNIQIDTDLAELSPENQHSASTRSAIEELSSNIQQRIILLVSGSKDDQVLEAEEALRDKLSQIDLLHVLPNSDDLAEQLIDQLKPYRFSLLTSQQRTKLESNTADEIAARAQQQLYQLSGQTRIYNFSDDPLGWHSDTLLELLSNPGSGVDRAANSKSQTIGLVINDGAMNMATQEHLLTRLVEINEAVEMQFSVEIDRSGIFFFAAHAAQSSKQDISLISTGSSIGIVLLLLFAFRSIKALMLPFLSVALGVSFAFVITHALYGNVHILTIVFGASLIGIVIDYSLHFFYHRIYHGVGDNVSLQRALLLSLMTSLIGYSALSFSSLEALQKVAFFSCCGLAMAWLSVVCLGDLGVSHNKKLNPYQSIFGKLVGVILNSLSLLSYRRWAAIGTCVVLSAIMICLFSNPFDDDPRLFFKAPQHLVSSELRVAKIANDYEPGRYIIVSGASQTEVHRRNTQLFELIEQSRGLSANDFTSLLNWIPNQSVQTGNYQLLSKLYSNDGAASILLDKLDAKTSEANTLKLIKQYEMAKQRYLTPAVVKQMLGTNTPPFWIEDDDLIVNFVLIRKGVLAEELTELTANLEGIEYVNTLARTRNALAEQRQSAVVLLSFAYGLVALLVLLRYRKLKSLWLVAVPIVSSAMLLTLSSVFGFYLTLFHVMALFLVLGFGMDYTIFAHEMRAQNNVTLQAILLSAFTSLLSFGLLALSSIPVVASFGITLLIGNFFNLLGAFIYSQSISFEPTTKVKTL